MASGNAQFLKNHNLGPISARVAESTASTVDAEKRSIRCLTANIIIHAVKTIKSSELTQKIFAQISPDGANLSGTALDPGAFTTFKVGTDCQF